MKTLRYSAVSPRRQQLIRICQALNFGALCDIRIESADPVLEGGSIVSEERLDLPDEPRPEIRLDDFNLCQEWRRLLTRFDAIQNGSIECIEVRAGIPRRVIFESLISGIRP
jgi:hypothetical protein